ncbi:MAG: LTA synthase family protein, partial [Puniceicoccales bacterium]|nr:LTA synthase family protein [Puniceicoccales bacterium]
KGLLCVLAPNAAAFVTALGIGMQEPGTQGKFLETLSQGLRHMTAFQPSFSNSFNTELAKNGEYALLAAFWSNELGYNEFYPKLPEETAYARLRELLQQDNTTFLSSDPRDISRQITGGAHPHRWNVIQITVESLSANYLGCYQQTPYSLMGLTPNLDRISKESLWFKNFYAGGTRTVRGMEALVLSVPPTPGQSVLRRPNNENLFTLGSVFQAKDYDTAFIYGGSGFFDNMNYFFANNGFRVVDRPAKVEKDNPSITFENAWGVCDEDLLDWTLTEADRAHEKGKNFYHFVMTTSNHRPFTWPEGRIDIPSGKGLREGGIKYTDYAIGRFLKEAEKRPWFKDTVFVIVADHCSSVAGKRELEVRKYEIPLFIYAPGLIKPRIVDSLCSQIDYAPTLLGLLDWTYQSRFMGRDVLRPSAESQRAFISNYQKIAILEDKSLGVLKPVGVSEEFFCDRSTGVISTEDTTQNRIINDAIAYYQCASEILANGRQKDFDHLAIPGKSVDVAHNSRRPTGNP